MGLFIRAKTPYEANSIIALIRRGTVVGFPNDRRFGSTVVVDIAEYGSTG